jgi:uncharacterized membrane protein YtjA (UPF0391 family)
MLTAMAILFLILAVIAFIRSRRDNAVNAKMLFYVCLALFLFSTILRMIRGS